MRKFILFGIIFSILPFLTTVIIMTGCKKTSSPLGIYAPNGFDMPTYTPTPQTGSIDVYVKDTNIAIQGVTIALLDPTGNTSSVNKTQQTFGFAAFNPPVLYNGIWHAVVPSQSVSYVTAGPSTIKNTYWNSTIPITVSGGGQYSVTFTTGGNSVAISPVSQTMSTSSPDYLPLTISYTENGNLDVPVSVTLSGYPTVTGFSLSSNPNFIFGGGVNNTAVSIEKNTCYYQPFDLNLNANNFSGIPIAQVGAVVTRSWSIPVTLFVQKTHINGIEYEQASIQTSGDCGAAIWYISVSINGLGTAAGYVANGGVQQVKNTGGQNFVFNFSVSCPSLGAGSVSGANYCAQILWDSWINVGTANF